MGGDTEEHIRVQRRDGDESSSAESSFNKRVPGFQSWLQKRATSGPEHWANRGIRQSPERHLGHGGREEGEVAIMPEFGPRFGGEGQNTTSPRRNEILGHSSHYVGKPGDP